MYTYRRPEVVVKESQEGFYMVDETQNMKSFDHTKIYRSDAFNEAMNYFDKSDSLTRNILLSVNEADQNVVMSSLSSKLYEHIKEHVEDVDFGTIPLSKGDITKIDNYEELVDCVNIITQILQQYNQNTESIETVSIAIQNMIDRTEMFEKAYRLNIEMPIITYNTIVLAIVSSVSYMISSCIEFVKMADDRGFDIAIDKVAAVKTKECVLFKDLARFNSACAKGEFDKAMNYVMGVNTKNFVGFTGLGAASAAAALGCLLLIVPIIRELIFFFYYSRTRVSNYFDAQAALLTMNAYNIENNLSREDKTRKEIAKKQMKIADKFKKIANAVKVNTKVGESKSDKEISKLNSTKFKHGDVMDSIPDSANSVLF